MTSRIGPQEKAFYEEHGYVIVPGLFDAASLARWNQRLEQVIDGSVPPAPNMLVMKDVMVAKGKVKPGTRAEAIAKLQDFEEDPVLFSYSTDQRLLDCAESLIGPNLITLHTMLINKPPNVDGRHPLHQDIIYFPYRPGDKIVGTWTALEKVTRENGCLVGIDGSHRLPILQHENPQWEDLNLGYFGAKGFGPDAQRVHFVMEPGDTLFFHPHLVHGAGRNRTQGFRRSILTHFCDAYADYDPGILKLLPKRHYKHVRGSLPSDAERPVVDLPPPLMPALVRP